MSIYMDNLPTSCECCQCNDDSYKCGATGELFNSLWDRSRLESCPIIPLADVVEVVRCRDCKYADEEPIADGRSWCNRHNAYLYYCSDGERR